MPLTRCFGCARGGARPQGVPLVGDCMRSGWFFNVRALIRRGGGGGLFLLPLRLTCSGGRLRAGGWGRGDGACTFARARVGVHVVSGRSGRGRHLSWGSVWLVRGGRVGFF